SPEGYAEPVAGDKPAAPVLLGFPFGTVASDSLQPNHQLYRKFNVVAICSKSAAKNNLSVEYLDSRLPEDWSLKLLSTRSLQYELGNFWIVIYDQAASCPDASRHGSAELIPQQGR